MSSSNLTFLDTNLKMPGGMVLPVRSVVIQLRDARILFSPGSKLTAEQLKSAGAITDIVAPSLLHVGGMANAAKFFPNARLWAPAGVEQKVPSLKWHGPLEQWPYGDEIELVPLGGMAKAKEYLALHRASKSLLATDFVFNLTDVSGLGAWIVLNLFGTYRRFAVSRLFLQYVSDREAFKASLPKVVSLDFDRIIPSHGAVLETDAKAKLAAALKERKLLA